MRPKVLFVDDEPHVLEGIQMALRRQPWDLLTASSAREALATLETTEVDVLVSDERMPEVCGSELLSLVCREYPSTVRVLLTGHASVEAAIRAINQGEIFRFLTKPCPPKELAATIERALELREELRRADEAEPQADEGLQRAALRDLEQSHPGITHVHRGPDGSIELRLTSVPPPK